MGIFSELIANARTFAVNGKVALKLRSMPIDPELPTEFDAEDAVHTLKQYTGSVTDGTFRLTITLQGGTQFTTAAIAFDADAATIEGAIDTAATAASIPDWTNGDISVAASATNLTDGDVTLTFDGDSVAGTNPGLTTIDDDGLKNPSARVVEEFPGNGTDTAEVQTLSVLNPSPIGGTYSLSFSLIGVGETTVEFNVQNIPYDAIDQTVISMIESAAVAAYPTWSGEISYLYDGFFAPLTAVSFSHQFNGGLLEEFADHPLIEMDTSNLTYDLLDPVPVVKTSTGQTRRLAWAALNALGVIVCDDPPEQSSPTTPAAGPNLASVKPWLILELAQEAAAEDGNSDTYVAICDAVFGTSHRQSMLVEP